MMTSMLGNQVNGIHLLLLPDKNGGEQVKENNRGFTLVEMLIAISIFTIVISIGFNILNKINIAIGEQKNITEDHLNVNLLNKYLTKDLEKCKLFNSPNDYEFLINDIKYQVEIVNDLNDGKEYYNLIRISGNSKIQLITKQLKLSSTPFFISQKQSNKNIYTVRIDNNIDSSKSYSFEVASRVVSSSSDINTNPENKFEELHKLSFWVKNNIDNPNHVDIGLSHSGAKYTPYERELKNINYNGENSYNISFSTSMNTSGKYNTMNISNGIGDEVGGLKDKFQVQNLQKSADKVVIVVSENTKFKFKINSSFITPEVQEGQSHVLLNSGTYMYMISPEAMDLELEGTIYKGQENSYIDILYGKVK